MEKTDQLNTTDLSSHIVTTLTSKRNDCFMDSVSSQCNGFYSPITEQICQFIGVLVLVNYLGAPRFAWYNRIHSKGRWDTKSLLVIPNSEIRQQF